MTPPTSGDPPPPPPPSDLSGETVQQPLEPPPDAAGAMPAPPKKESEDDSGSESEDSSPSSDSEDEYVQKRPNIPDEEVARLIGVFRPVIDILLPASNDDDPEQRRLDEKDLVEFFYSQDVKTLEDLKTLDEGSVQWFTGKTFPVFREEKEKQYGYVSYHVSEIGNYVENYGLYSLLTRLAQVKNTLSKKSMVSTPAAISKQIFLEFYWYNSLYDHDRRQGDDSDDKLANYFDWLPKNLDKLTLGQARECLARIFKNTGPFEYMHFFNPGDSWKQLFKIAKGALPILDAHPQLAAEEFECQVGHHGRLTSWHPYFILLFCNFYNSYFQDDLARVRSYHPISLEKKAGALCDLLRFNHLWFERGFVYRLIPKDLLEYMLEMDPELMTQSGSGTGAWGKSIPETLLRWGYCPKIPEPAKSLTAKLETFRIDARERRARKFTFDRLDKREAKWLQETLIPHVKYFECRPHWDGQGFSTLAQALAGAERLEHLLLTVPVQYLLHMQDQNLLSLAQPLLQPVSLNSLHLEMLDNDGDAEIHFNKALANALRAVKKESSSWGLPALRLDVVNEIGQALFAPDIDMYQSIDISVCESRAIENESLVIENDTSTGLTGTTGAPIGTLLIDCRSEPSQWDEICSAISKLKRVERITFCPASAEDYIPSLLKSTAAMSTLRDLKLLSAPATEGEGPMIDYTASVCAILDRTPLQSLYVEGDLDDEHPSVQIQAHLLCESLQRNKTLQSLQLHTVSLDGTVTPQGGSVTGLFVEVLDEFSNTTLQDLVVYSEKLRYTALDLWPRRERGLRGRYEDFEASQKLQYLLSLNAAGRAKMEGKSHGAIAVRELLNLLAQVGDSTECKQSLCSQIVQLATSTNSNNLQDLYNLLRKTPNKWSGAPDAESLSIVYDLLSDSFSLWCPSARLESGSL